jgi:NHL repeat
VQGGAESTARQSSAESEQVFQGTPQLSRELVRHPATLTFTNVHRNDSLLIAMKRLLFALSIFLLIPLAAQFWRIYGQTSNGVITTVAGTGTTLFCCDGAVATEANLAPQAVAVDPAGTLYVADSANHRIRKIDFSSGNGIISTATSAVNSPSDVKADSAGNLYIADPALNQVFKFQPKGGGFTTLAGTGDPGFNGDGGLAIFAQLNSPSNVAIDAAGNVYILDAGNSRIRRIAADTQIIQRLREMGLRGFPVMAAPLQMRRSVSGIHFSRREWQSIVSVTSISPILPTVAFAAYHPRG